MERKKLTYLPGQKTDEKRIKITLTGILWDAANERILLVKNPQGKIYLPGGSCKKFTSKDSEAADKFKKNLQGFVYKKSGILVRVEDLLFFRFLEQSSRPIKVYDLQLIKTDSKNIRWEKSPGYQPIWLTPEQIANNKAVSRAVKSIIADYLSENNLQSIKAL